MDDLAIIDRFTETFSRYIDSGFGLLASDVGFLVVPYVVKRRTPLKVVTYDRILRFNFGFGHSAPETRNLPEAMFASRGSYSNITLLA